MIGERLGPYRIEAELGSGGMGTVWLAEVERDAGSVARGARVAVKVVHAHLIANPGVLERFRREAEVGRRVVHENVVRTLDAGSVEQEGRLVPYLVMERVEGKTLRTLLSELGTVPEALLREIAAQVAAGLAAIHACGVVHRDLKPENVLIDAEHRVRIMDLGVARILEGASGGVTQEGQFAGSLLYAAPERFHRGDAGPLADLYSLGATLYELGTGRSPFEAGDTAGVIQAHLTRVPERADRLNPEISPFLAVAVATLLAKEPEGRFPSAAAFREAVEGGERSAWWGARESSVLGAEDGLPRIEVRRETPLAGREPEMKALLAAWEAARAGEGTTVLLEGEAGIGKSRLVDEFLRALPAGACWALYGSYPPAGGAGALADAVVSRFGRAGLADALRPHLREAPGLVPAFAAHLRREAAPEGAVALTGDALHAAYVAMLRGLSDDRPVVWVVDDLHFAPEDGRRVALSLARAVEGRRVLLLLTSRPGLPEEEIAHFARTGRFQRMTVGRLSPREVMRLLRDALRSDPLADRLGGRIAFKSDGVPFFVFEIVRGLREGRFIAQAPDGRWVETRVVEDIEVPSAVRDLIEGRLQGLSFEDRNLLDVAAVEGYEFDPDLVARACDMKRVHVLQRLAALERSRGVVRAAGRRFRFDHHQVQEVLYGDLAQGLREEYHALLAEVFAAREGLDVSAADKAPGDAAVFLARHALLGSRPADALPWLQPALQSLAHAYRAAEGLALLAQALAVPGLLEGVARARALLRRATWLGLLGHVPEERAALDEALTLADASGEAAVRAMARTRLSSHLDQVARYAEARARLTEALEIARGAGEAAEEREATGILGNVCYSEGRYEECLGHQRRHLALARAAGDKAGEMWATGNIGLVLVHLARYDEAWAHLQGQIDLCTSVKDRRSQSIALGNLGLLASALGRLDEARSFDERNLALAREIGFRQGESTATGNLGGVFFDLGRTEEAIACYERYLALSREMGARHAEAIARVNLGAVYTVLGDTDRARTEVLASRALCREIGARRVEGYALFGLGEVLEQAGEVEAAVATLQEALALRREIGYRRGYAETAETLGGVLSRAGRDDEARPLLEEAVSIAREIDAPHVLAVAAARLASMSSGRAEDAVSEALAAFAESDPRLSHRPRMEARFLLWRATSDASHLAAARDLLFAFRDGAPASHRSLLMERVGLHREIALAAAPA